jgi:murein L,D-transpeptidase YcbB/YkuD
MIASNIGASATAVQTAQAIDTIKTGVEVASVTATHKSLTDHALSAVTGRDCNLVNIFDKYHKVCRELIPDLTSPEKIKEFQKAKGIDPTGTLGPKTRMAIWRIKNELD